MVHAYGMEMIISLDNLQKATYNSTITVDLSEHKKRQMRILISSDLFFYAKTLIQRTTFSFIFSHRNYICNAVRNGKAIWQKLLGDLEQ